MQKDGIEYSVRSIVTVMLLPVRIMIDREKVEMDRFKFAVAVLLALVLTMCVTVPVSNQDLKNNSTSQNTEQVDRDCF